MNNALVLTSMTELTARQQLNIAALISSYSANTQKAMKSVWRLYSDWCQQIAVDPYQLDAVQVSAFLLAHPARHATQQARLAHLRNIIGLVADATDQPALKQVYATLKRFKLSTDTESAYYAPVLNRRTSQALSPRAVWKVLEREWPKRLETVRNRAMLALLFYSGLRRSELVKLRWADVRWEVQTLSIVGSKKRAADQIDGAPLTPEAESYLKAWLAEGVGGREYVFCRIDKAGNLGADKPLSGQTVLRICGPEFMPHDARRTLGTQAIKHLMSLSDVQAALRHKTPTMTLHYSKHVEVTKLAGRMKLGY